MVNHKKDNKFQLINFFRIYGSVILDLSTGLLVGGVVGYYIDETICLYPVCMIIFSFFGFFGGIANLFKKSRKL